MKKDTALVRELVQEIRVSLSESNEVAEDEEVMEEIESFVLYDSRTKTKTFEEKREIIRDIFNAIRKELDVLQPLADDADINEIMVNGTEDIFVEKLGKIERADVHFEDIEHLEEIIRRVAAKVQREINELSPIVDARLEDGSRVSAVYKNIALNGPILTIRKFPKSRIQMDDLISSETITTDAAQFLKRLVQCGYNIFISGGTSSGKTTFLNVLSGYIPPDERVIIIEDSAELQISDIANIVRLEARNANVQGKGEVPMRSLIKASLRMRPDRIVVGEVRGAEVVDMIQAMNTGHDGSLSTGHANSPVGMISRLETMFLSAMNFPIEAVRAQICSAIDIIVHMGKMKDRRRRVLEIAEVEGYEEGRVKLNVLYRYNTANNGTGRLERTENSLKNTRKLEMKEVI